MLQYWKKYRFPFLIALVFVWMMFIDSNSIINLIGYKSQLKNLKNQEAYYLSEIERMKEEKEIIFSDMRSLETYARERYYMKKDNEDIYIIQEEE